jgi:hypothetical protein
MPLVLEKQIDSREHDADENPDSNHHRGRVLLVAPIQAPNACRGAEVSLRTHVQALAMVHGWVRHAAVSRQKVPVRGRNA